MDARCPVCGQMTGLTEMTADRIGRCAACKGLYEVASGGTLRSVRSQGEEGADITRPVADVRYKCTGCNTVLESPCRLAGQQDQCPICGHSNTVPSRRKLKESKRREEDVFASEGKLGLQAAGGADAAGDASMAGGVDTQEPSEVPLMADEVAGGSSGRRRASVGAATPSDGWREAQWFYISGSEQVGPISFGAMRDLVRAGHLQASSMVWREGMDRWAQLGTTPEFSAILMTGVSQPVPAQQWPAQYHDGLSAMAKKRSGLAVASLVCSVVGLLLFGVILGLLGIIFGGVAISKVNQNPRAFGGKGMAVAGLVIGIFDMALGIILLMLMGVFR